jgi:hypothetical protein
LSHVPIKFEQAIACPPPASCRPEPGKLADPVVVDSETFGLVAVMRLGRWVRGADRFGAVAPSGSSAD